MRKIRYAGVTTLGVRAIVGGGGGWAVGWVQVYAYIRLRKSPLPQALLDFYVCHVARMSETHVSLPIFSIYAFIRNFCGILPPLRFKGGRMCE